VHKGDDVDDDDHHDYDVLEHSAPTSAGESRDYCGTEGPHKMNL